MPRLENSLLVLLAAGRSCRFGGGESKLTQEWEGRPLGLHAAGALGALPFRRRLAVVGDPALDYAGLGFDAVRNEQRDEGMASSVRLGVRHAREVGAEALVVALADMPCVTAAHVRRLFDASSDEHSMVASSDGNAAKPPALFGRAHFDALLVLTGDSGGRELLRNATLVPAGPAELVDIDTPAELDALRAATRAAGRRSD